jgi:hypothetical protein
MFRFLTAPDEITPVMPDDASMPHGPLKSEENTYGDGIVPFGLPLKGYENGSEP